MRRTRLGRVLAAVGVASLATTTAVGLPTPTSAAAATTVVVPAVPAMPAGLSAIPLDPATPYVPQNSCDGVVKPGVVSFERLVLATYPVSGSSGDARPCGTDGSVSEHYDGRAWDWRVSVLDPAQKAAGDALSGWLIANNGEMARRFGIMYIIWNDRIWGVYSASAGWRSYGGCPTGNLTGCHEDHVHFSFGWAGAQGRTSWWTGRSSAVDYGPGALVGLTYAPADKGTRNTSPCVAVAAVAPATPLLQWSGAVERLGSYGPSVPPVQRAIGVPADGNFGAATDSGLRQFQQAHAVPVTGVTDVATWDALLSLGPPPPAPINGHDVHGAILTEYLALGGPGGFLGLPTTDETATPDGVGRFNYFAGGAIYWTPATGAHELHGAILGHWAELGWETGVLGYPATDETGTPDGVGRYNYFSRGGMYWTPGTGAHEVHGAILGDWARLGWETGLGYPVTDETGTPDGVGRYNHFSGAASVYWSPASGAHAVYGAIRATWAAMGWETGWLRYPSSDEHDAPGGRQSDFAGGSIRWDAATGLTSARPA